MEIFILVAIVFIFWTNEVLLGKKKLFEEKKKPSDLDKLADALKTYLNNGVNVNVKDKGPNG